MVLKTVVMLSMFFVPIILINTGIVASPLLLFALYITSGLGMAGIGMGVMHDAIHGSYSSNKKVNKVLGYTMNMIGANATVWKIQHNVLHHTYTNIEHSDDDINPPPFILRFTPHAKKYWQHRFQHIYIWFFYCLSTISWITSKDFVRLHRYYKMGLFSSKKKLGVEMLKVASWKLVYYSYALVLPLLMVPLSPWIIVLAFISMHLVTGFLISIVFQMAHIMPDVDFPLPDESGQMDNEWFAHQLATTTNFCTKNNVLTWMVGGLNFQVEHHLLPHVCHVHYKKLAPIVEETAKEFGLPYNNKKTFLSAMQDHTKMLRYLGQVELKPVG